METRDAHRFVVGAACLDTPLSIGATQQSELVSAAGGTLAGGAGHVLRHVSEVKDGAPGAD
jgi:hypothetical protein